MKVDFAKLDRAFNPLCVVVIGDSGGGNFSWLRAQSEFTGKLYSVQINPKTIKRIEAMGIKNYTSLLDVPEAIDLAIVSVPRNAALKVLEDCIKKEVAAAHFFTAGFAETDTDEGRELEKLIVQKARKAKFNLIGPNCMGIFNPGVGIKQSADQYSGSTGPVGFISQSGTHAGNFSRQSHIQGMDINKSVSFGNGIILDSTDYLEYFGSDPDIKIIGMYLEGVRGGKRFMEVLKKVSASKPVVIWKGGRTEAGGRAIKSHTGSMAVQQVIWDTAIKQCGAISVSDIEQLVDTIKALLFLPPVHGDRVGIVGGSGGQSVAVADVFNEAGLTVPPLTRDSYDELAKFFTLIGGGYRNPIDTGNPNSREMKRILEILERDKNTDNLVFVTSARSGPRGSSQANSNNKILSDIKKKTSKPVMAIVSFSTPNELTRARAISEELETGGIPVFLSMERGSFALKKALEYYRLHTGNDRKS